MGQFIYLKSDIMDEETKARLEAALIKEAESQREWEDFYEKIWVNKKERDE